MQMSLVVKKAQPGRLTNGYLGVPCKPRPLITCPRRPPRAISVVAKSKGDRPVHVEINCDVEHPLPPEVYEKHFAKTAKLVGVVYEARRRTHFENTHDRAVRKRQERGMRKRRLHLDKYIKSRAEVAAKAGDILPDPFNDLFTSHAPFGSTWDRTASASSASRDRTILSSKPDRSAVPAQTLPSSLVMSVNALIPGKGQKVPLAYVNLRNRQEQEKTHVGAEPGSAASEQHLRDDAGSGLSAVPDLATHVQGPPPEPAAVTQEARQEPATLTQGAHAEPATVTYEARHEPATLMGGAVPELATDMQALPPELPPTRQEPATLTRGPRQEPVTGTQEAHHEPSNRMPGTRQEPATHTQGPHQERATHMQGPRQEPATHMQEAPQERATRMQGPRQDPVTHTQGYRQELRTTPPEAAPDGDRAVPRMTEFSTTPLAANGASRPPTESKLDVEAEAHVEDARDWGPAHAGPVLDLAAMVGSATDGHVGAGGATSGDAERGPHGNRKRDPRRDGDSRVSDSRRGWRHDFQAVPRTPQVDPLLLARTPPAGARADMTHNAGAGADAPHTAGARADARHTAGGRADAAHTEGGRADERHFSGATHVSGARSGRNAQRATAGANYHFRRAVPRTPQVDPLLLPRASAGAQTEATHSSDAGHGRDGQPAVAQADSAGAKAARLPPATRSKQTRGGDGGGVLKGGPGAGDETPGVGGGWFAEGGARVNAGGQNGARGGETLEVSVRVGKSEAGGLPAGGLEAAGVSGGSVRAGASSQGVEFHDRKNAKPITSKGRRFGARPEAPERDGPRPAGRGAYQEDKHESQVVNQVLGRTLADEAYPGGREDIGHTKVKPHKQAMSNRESRRVVKQSLSPAEAQGAYERGAPLEDAALPSRRSARPRGYETLEHGAHNRELQATR